jgi:Rrf2 family protein
MKLTARCEYALLALTYLSRHESEEYVSVDRIAAAQSIPPRFLEQILLVLKRARLVTSGKGARGGYRMARPPERVTLAEIIRTIDGALAPTESVSKYFYEPTPIEKEKRLLRVFRQIRDLIADRLEHVTLADVS